MPQKNGTRRTGALISLVLLLCLSLCLPSCTFPLQKRYARVIDGPFDTATQLVIYSRNKSNAEAFFDAFEEKITAWDKLADIYHEYDGINNLRTLNLSAGGDPVALDPRLLDLLEYGLTKRDETNGRVDLLLGPVLSLWHECRTAGLADPDAARTPTESELAAASATAKRATLHIDRAAGTAYLPVPGSSVDVGAFAKGYAVERISAELESDGYTDFAANVGGNLRVSGDAAGEPWTLSVRDPAGGTVGRIERSGSLSLVTSGSYERYYTVDGVRYHHIVDPDTNYPAAFGWTSVSVLCADAGVADVLSTALFCLDREAGVSLLSAFGSSVSVLWITESGERFGVGAFAEGGGS